MKIIIVGGGKLGSALAESLSREAHDITLIDNDENALRRASDTLDVLCVKGNGASLSALREAGAAEADLVITTSGMDEINMICSLAAKRLGAKYTIARIRDVGYTSELATFKKELDIDSVINPELATAVEISQLLRFPPACDVEVFFRGRVELAGFTVQESDFFVGTALSGLPPHIKNLSVLFCAVERQGRVLIPDGAFTPQSGDTVYLIGKPPSLQSFFRVLGRYVPSIRSAFIVGGSRIAHYLAVILNKMDVAVKLVEENEARCRTLAEALPHSLILCGDGTDQELLEVEHFTGSDAFVALTGRDEDNLILSLYARQRGIGRVVAKSSRPNYLSIAHNAGLESIVSPKLITVSYILRLVRALQSTEGSAMTALYRIAGGKAEALEFTAGVSTPGLGTPLKDLKLKKGILIAAISHEGKVIIPEGSDCIYASDSVIIISQGHIITDINDIFDSPVTG